MTGIRRSGKSFLLSTLFKNRLIEEGARKEDFVEVALDRKSDIKYRNPNLLYDYIMKCTKDTDRKFYVLIDEIQLSYKVKNGDVDESLVPEEDRGMLYTTFYDILNDLMARPNLDVYVTGSNSKMLSKDIVTNFRDRGSEIKVYPLSFAEYLSVVRMEEADALSSPVGSLTNPNKLANTAGSLMGKLPSHNTINNYLDYVEDAFLFQSARRWDVKGRKYFDKIQKYYAMDLGLRNARLNFRQQERSHLMENMIYNDLIRRGYSVDVGIVELTRVIDGKRKLSQYEIDFVVNVGNNKVYIQSALNVDTPEKKAQETFSLRNTGDFFRKIVVLDGSHKLWSDEDGVMYVGVIPFLLEDIVSELIV